MEAAATVVEKEEMMEEVVMEEVVMEEVAMDLEKVVEVEVAVGVEVAN